MERRVEHVCLESGTSPYFVTLADETIVLDFN
jgi:hypothetical protein